jgi:malate dehydrogenase (quinone)
MSAAESESPDVVLIGAGIISATSGTILKELEPTLGVVMFETLHYCAQESSEAWNNAGTGHAANCELNYTPRRSDESSDISQALKVNTEFDVSRQLWSYLVAKGAIPDPSSFIEPCPQMSLAWGEENVAFLRDRYKAMSSHHCYSGMEFSEDHGEIAEWAPLVMEGRDKDQLVSATRMITGTDIDYGALTHLLVTQLHAQPGYSVHYKHKVVDLDRLDYGRWVVTAQDVTTPMPACSSSAPNWSAAPTTRSSLCSGPSPSASTAAFIAVEVLEKCFEKELVDGWRDRLQTIIPTYGIDLTQDADACRDTRAKTAAVLRVENV